MRIGLQLGPERGRYPEKVAKLLEGARRAEELGYHSVWVPQLPDDFDALTAIALMGQVTERVELGTAVMPIQSRHPVAMAQQALSTQAACNGRFVLGLGPSHHWIVSDMLGLPYEKPAGHVRAYVEVLRTAFAGPGPVDVENDWYTVHNPLDVTDLPTPILVAALGPTMLRTAGELADGTILWMADEKAIAEHIVPRITEAATGAGRPAPRVVAGVPVTLCSSGDEDEVRAWTNRALAHAEYSPNYQTLLDRGDASDVGDMAAVGDEAAIAARLASYRDAGATDIAVRVVPWGKTREERIASRDRTESLVATLA
jgi:F420-dependent oxidoreductase-like protein